MIPTKQNRKPPSKLKEDQLSGKNLVDKYNKPQIIQFLNINDFSAYPDSVVPIDEPLFQPMPVVIQFTGYEPLQTKSQVLKLRNKDKVSRKVKIIPPDSNLFQVIPCKQAKIADPRAPQDVDNMSSQVAPGMEISYIVKFSPESKIDYSYDLNVLTEREKFVVPIRAVGCKAILEFPDVLDFGKVPVKHEAVKPVVISNIGEKATKWQLSLLSSCISAKKTEGILEVGQSEQLLFRFAPQEVKMHSERAILSYDMLEAEVQLKGESYEAKVYLSRDSLRMKPTYISLTYCDFVEIVNDSNVAVEFSWRAAHSEKEEKEKREKIIKNLESEEAAERVVLEEAQFEESEEESLDSDDSYDEDELNKKRERKAKKKRDVVARNYLSMKANIGQEVLFFNDDNDTYKIEPQTGKIWPKSKVTIAVSFTPKSVTPKTGNETPQEAFCNVTCCEERLKLQLFGIGLGPEAKILPQSWCLNDVSVNERQTQTIKIFNQGQIPFPFAIKPNNTAFGRLFTFSESEGYLETAPPNNEKSVVVEFISSKVGDFSERFEIQMGKDGAPHIFTCEGKVIAPPMKFEEMELDFKRVPFGFDEIKEVSLINLSNVKIDFEVEVPDEVDKRTFIPESVPQVINPMDKAKIKVRFVPPKEGEFTASLTVKVPNVAQDFATLPLRGVCQRPTVEIVPPDYLNFGQVYLRKPKTMQITLTNTSDLRACYKAVPQDEANKRLAIYTIAPQEGEIKPHGTFEVSVTLQAETRGSISGLPMYLNVSSKVMHERVDIKAEVLGPQVEVDAQLKDFKEVKVLSKAKDKVTIHNVSEIPAKYTAFTREKNSIFRVDQRTGSLEPNAEKELTITCMPDDAQLFDDVLYIDINDGTHAEVKLKARALGTSICIPGYESSQIDENNQKLPIYVIDFGTHYINFEAVKLINVENRGRRRQSVRFERLNAGKSNRQKRDKEQKDMTTSQVTTETRKQKEEEDEEANHVFSIEPFEEEKGVRGVLLDPQRGFTLNCKARSKNIQKGIIEPFKFLACFDGTRKEEGIFIVNFKGNFILPQLSFSVPKLCFKYTWQGEEKREPIVKDLEISCESDDPTKGAGFRLNVPLPFRTKDPIEKFMLLPGSKQQIKIEFDPSGTDDRMCKTLTGNVEFIYDRDKGGAGRSNYLLPLEGELCYPNLEVAPTSIDFRCILFDTSKKEYLTLKNVRELPVRYHWEFFEEISDVITELPDEENKQKHKKQSQPKPSLPVNELFDILPISGVLQSGEVETVEITFHALVRNPKPAYARCMVEGGAEYIVTLKGESADIVEPKLEERLDFSYVTYCDEEKKSFNIKNSGKVAFKYFVSLEKVSRPEMFRIEKQSGTIMPDATEKVDVRLRPGIPDEIHEELLVYIAHLEPRKILVTGVGTFPLLIFSTQRSDKEKFDKKVEEMEKALSKPSHCLQPAEEIQRLLSKKPEAMNRSQMSMMFKPQHPEIESEVDRQELCRVLLNKQHAGLVMKTHAGDKKTKVDIVVGKYTFDFGNIVGGTRKQSIPFFNVGRVSSNISVYVQEQKENDITVKATVEKVKLPPLEGTVLNFNMQIIKKKLKPASGKKVIPVFIEVKGGPRYEIDFEANITTPELSFSQDVVNFGEVICGQRKTITLRFENRREVDCEWSYMFKDDVASSGKDKKETTPTFVLSPNTGKLAPGEKMNVELIFTPSAKKDYELKVQPVVKNSQGKPNMVKLVGKGILCNMKLDKLQLTLGPQLPYVDTKQYLPVKIINETNVPIEVYSVEFDRAYIREEKMLMAYKKLDSNKAVAVPVRVPGAEFWKDIADEVDRNNKSRERIARIAKIDELLKDVPSDDEEKKAALQKEREELEQAKLQEEAADIMRPQAVPKVNEDRKVNVVVIGWDRGTKTTICNYLAEEHKRGVVNLAQVLQWNMQKNTSAAQTAQQYLADKAKEFSTLKEEFEKKKKRPKKGEPEPVLNEADFKILPRELFVELVRNRLTDEDCNAGAIFDSLESEHCRGQVDVVELISEASGPQNLRVVLLQYVEKKEEGTTKAKVETAKEEVKVEEKKEKEKGKEKERKEQGKKEEKKLDTDFLFGFDKEVKKTEEKKEVLPESSPSPSPQAEEEEGDKTKFRPKRLIGEEEKKAYLELYAKMEQKMAELTVKALASQNPNANKAPEAKKPDEEEIKKVEPPQTKASAVEEKKQSMAAAEKTTMKMKSPEKAPEKSEAVEEKSPTVPEVKIKYGDRIATPVEMEYDGDKLLEEVIKHIPEPEYPNSSKMPLPPARVEQLLTKPKESRQYPDPIPQFTLLTAKKPTKSFEVSADNNTSSPNKDLTTTMAEETKKEEQQGAEYEERARWVLGARDSQEVFVKFYSEKIGEFKQSLHFGIVGGERLVELVLEGNCEYPLLSDNPKTIFGLYGRRQLRASLIPEKKFDKARNSFDFGPLLIGKEFDKRLQQEKCKINMARFSFSNAGHFPLHVDFTLRSQSKEYEAEHKTPFYIEPSSLDIPALHEAPYEIKVWAFPDKAVEYRDALVCVIADNPKPVVFGMVCYGSQPDVKVDSDNILFEKLLVHQQSSKELKITNESRIPINWKLQGIEKLPKELAVSLKEGAGLLRPLESTVMQFTFSPAEQKEYEFDFTLLVCDEETKELKQQPKPIKLKAKSYLISVAPRFETEKMELNFGAVRVGETAERKFFLKNNGLYEVRYRVLLKSRDYRERFTISEMQGVLNAGEEKQISVHFKSKTGWSQSTNSENASMAVQIMEGGTGKEREEIPIKISVKAMYSQFSIAPVRGINFGPMQYGENKTLMFEIKNDGKFDFAYTIYDYKDNEARTVLKEQRSKEGEDLTGDKGGDKKKEEKKPAKGGKGKVDVEGTLRVGQFAILPSRGNITPGSSATIKVTFEAEGAKFYESNLAIDISGRDYVESPEGVQYQLVGESCIPGINAEDVQSIFEEQRVVSTLDPGTGVQTVITKSIFATEENVFWFGTLVPAKDTKGQIEKFKIMNPNKIPCTVNISVKPRTASKSEGFGFEISPASLRIPPHESQYVKVCFKPINIMSYGGVFEAIVDNGDPKSKSGQLKFELRGEGVLPTVMMEKPNPVGNEGIPVLRFRRTRLGNTQRESIILKNEGSVPATVQFDPITSEVFSLVTANSMTIVPKTYQQFEIGFEPKEAREIEHTISFVTVNNPYEAQKVTLVGEGYQEVLVFENLPENAEDEIRIGDCGIEKIKKVQFTMASKADKYLRFEWINHRPELKCYPRVGFLKPHGNKNMLFAFRAKQPTRIEAENVWCRLTEISATESTFSDWDETFTETRMVRPSELQLLVKQRADQDSKRLEENQGVVSQIVAAKAAALAVGKSGKPAGDKKKEVKKEPKKDAKAVAEPAAEIKVNESEAATEEINEPVKEPEYKTVENSEITVGLKCTATADYSKYECSVNHVTFKPTLMFQTRSFKFAVKNTSLIAVNYSCKFTNSDTGTVDSGPYSIIPRNGVITSGCEEAFIVKFSPIEAEDSFARLLVVSVPNLDPTLKPLVIEVDGSSERPVCHFELPPSKYREKKEKDMAPIDNKYSIVEFESLGTRVKNIKRFMVVNPTSLGYEFEWDLEEDKGKPGAKPMFKCLTPKGTILSGKKFEMAFEYVPDAVGTHESYWAFKVPSEKVVQQFLIVGQVLEPLVMFETAKVDFGPLLVGGKNREIIKLVNQEHIPFPFAFDYKSVKGAPEDGDSLTVAPLKGIIEPQSTVQIEITFLPRFEKAFNYNLVCKVKRKGRPLNVNVKGVGYLLRHEVYIESNKSPIQPKDNLAVDFGDFFINEKKTRTVTICNLGEFNFDFVWKRATNRYLTITPESGSVKKGSKLTVELTYLPLTPHKLAKYKCALSIVSGPTYELMLVGSARKPGVEFSFQKFDFGKCFVMRQPLSKTKTLEMKNAENTALSIDLLFEKKPYLDVQLNPGQVLLPYTAENKEKITVPIIFTPRDIKKYEETFTFDFNGIYKANLVVTGEGIPLVLELTRPEDQFLDFGVIKVNGDSTRTATLINKSKKAVTFKIFPESEVEFGKCCLSLNQDSDTEITLKPNETLPVEIRYQPTLRMPAFKHDIMLQIKDNETRRLTTISGVSHGIEVKFIEDTLGFGSVVKGSRLTKQLQMANFGDIDAKFSWDTKGIAKHFTIIPATGHVPPQEDHYFEIVFHPNSVNDDIRYDNVKCKIEGSDPLTLSLIGKCVNQSKENTKELFFETEVRSPTTSTVAIENPTSNAWTIKPTISTVLDSCKDFFKGAATLEVPPKGKGNYEVVYHPLTMTKEQAGDPEDPAAKAIIHYHEASLFFPLPDGSALLYNLFGQSKPSQALDTIKETATAKRPKFVSIPVKNWLNEVQRFTVSWKLGEGTDPATFIRGANTFDVAGNSNKEYKLNFLAFKEGACKFTLTFKNDTTEEYVFYEMEIAIAPPEVLGEIELASVVRESIVKVITIENPLQSPVTIDKAQFTIDSDYVFVTPESLTIPAQRESAIEINFRPLIVEQKDATLTLENPDLGTFAYNLKLNGLKSTMQRSMHFKASLGAELVQAFRFTHYVKQATNYAVKIERVSGVGMQGGAATDFKAEQTSISAQAAEAHNGVDLSTNVKFEPNNIGESRAILIISNPDGVEYTCLLYGHATAPQPQPITKIADAKTASIDFKNPLGEKCEFAIRFDNDCFSLGGKQPGPIEPGKSTTLQVRFDYSKESSSTGRMFISTKDLPPWIYYLHGEK